MPGRTSFSVLLLAFGLSVFIPAPSQATGCFDELLSEFATTEVVEVLPRDWLKALRLPPELEKSPLREVHQVFVERNHFTRFHSQGLAELEKTLQSALRAAPDVSTAA